MIYSEMLERVRTKNPEDPRIKALYLVYQDRLGAGTSSQDRGAKRKKTS